MNNIFVNYPEISIFLSNLHLRRGKTDEVEETNDIEAGKDPEGVSPPEDGGNRMLQTCWLLHLAELVQGLLHGVLGVE